MLHTRGSSTSRASTSADGARGTAAWACRRCLYAISRAIRRVQAHLVDIFRGSSTPCRVGARGALAIDTLRAHARANSYWKATRTTSLVPVDAERRATNGSASRRTLTCNCSTVARRVLACVGDGSRPSPSCSCVAFVAPAVRLPLQTRAAALAFVARRVKTGYRRRDATVGHATRHAGRYRR